MNIEAEAAEALRWAGRHFHHQTPAAPAAATISTTPGGPMSVFTEIKTGAHDLLERLEGLDENAIGAVEAIKVNPTGVSIVNTVASIAHLPDPQGLLAGADALLKNLAAAIAAGVQATVPDVQAVPSGPSVAGQA